MPDELSPSDGELTLTGTDDIVEIERPPYRTWGPFAWSHKARREVVLTVRNVERVDLHDDAHIGGVSVASLRYDYKASTLSIVGNAPTQLTMHIVGVDATLLVTDIQHRRGRHWGFNTRRGTRR